MLLLTGALLLTLGYLPAAPAACCTMGSQIQLDLHDIVAISSSEDSGISVRCNGHSH